MTKRSTVNTGAFDALLRETTPPAKPAATARKKKAEPKARRKASAGAKQAPAKAAPRKKQAPEGQAAFPVPTGQPDTARPPLTLDADGKPIRDMLSLRFDRALLERARNACYATGKTFQQMTDYALWNMVYALESWNGGKPYPSRPRDLKPGPRPKPDKAK